MTPITKAVEYVGGQHKLAEKCRVTSQAISKWCALGKPVPIKYLAIIEKATHGNVTIEQLRPDIYKGWTRIK